MNLQHFFRRFLLFGLVLSPVILGIGFAYADEDIPAYKVLKCEFKGCPNITPPVALDTPKPVFPAYIARMHVEAMVDIRYTVDKEGEVTNEKVEQLLGPQIFADRALAALAGRKFKPATENGKPVSANTRTRFMFRIRGEKGARRAVASNFDRAMSLAKEGNTIEAATALRSIAAESELNFYERTMVSYALAMLYVQSKDYGNALDQIHSATIADGYYLDSRSREQALRLRVALEEQEGQWAEAFAWFDILKKNATVAADDPMAALIAKLHASIEAPQPLAFDVEIPRTPEATWQHTLLRRTFGFAQINGKLDGFELRCDAHGIESVVSENAQWTVPKSWTGCMIYVKGQPNATFRFLEAHSSNS